MVIYISAPYTNGDPILNVRRVIDHANHLLEEGHTPIVPHLTMLWHMMTPKPWEDWIKYDLKLLLLADRVHRLSGESKGADLECKEADRLGLTVLHL